MKTVPLPEGTPWEQVLPTPSEEGVVLVRDGHAVALLIPFDDDDLEWYLRERDPAFRESIARARRQVEEGRTIGHDDLCRELGTTPGPFPTDLDTILDRLDRHHQRATYGAVVAIVGGSPRSVMAGRVREPRTSWVVDAQTRHPTGYQPGEEHPALVEHDRVIDDPDELAAWLADHP